MNMIFFLINLLFFFIVKPYYASYRSTMEKDNIVNTLLTHYCRSQKRFQDTPFGKQLC